MIRISGIPVLNLFKTVTSFMAAWDRRAQRTGTRGRKGRFSGVLRDKGLFCSNPDLTDARSLSLVSGPAIPISRSGVLALSRLPTRKKLAPSPAASVDPAADDHALAFRKMKSSGAIEPARRLIERSNPHSATGAADMRFMRAGAGDVERYRRHVRIRPRHRTVTVVTEQGARYDAEILDLSQSGVALEGTMPGVWIGSMVTVGSRRAKAVRMLPQGMALEFSVPIPAKALHVDTVL